MTRKNTDDKSDNTRSGANRTILERALDEADKPRPPDQRRRIFEMIADTSQEWWAELVESHTAKGMASAIDSYREAITEIERIDQRLSGFGARVDVRVNGIRISELDFGAAPDDGQVEEPTEGE